MTVSLNIAAQTLIDLYYQDYAPADAFIDIEHVKLLMIAEYERMLIDDFNRDRLLSRTIEGYASVQLDGDWIIPSRVKVAKDDLGQHIATLPQSAQSFPADKLGQGVQRVRPVGGKCKMTELIRIAASDAWMMCLVPSSSNTYYYVQTISKGIECPSETRLVIIGGCIPTEIDAEYVPSLMSGGDVLVQVSKVKVITDSVLQSLLIARQQVVIDKTNDGNPNTDKATETNPDNARENP